ncbi:MAG: hypothetical protein M1829_000286 [Trizodia sp. TS-e1964]|nr:MAG: hypothetical protein M1829_000286 [Trizodia sp. TS-e1964]
MPARVTRSAAAKGTDSVSDAESENENQTSAEQEAAAPLITPRPKKTPAVRKGRAAKLVNASPTKARPAEEEPSPLPVQTPVRKRKRTAKAPVPEEDINELPHNLGKIVFQAPTDNGLIDEPTKPALNGKLKVELKPSDKTVMERKIDVKYPGASTVENEDLPEDESPRKKARRAKANPYGLTPGETPFPDWPHPTHEECQVVHDLLTTIHGEVKAPATIPAPSLTVTGCGEVPSILDALIRTLLSAATTGGNSARAFKGLVDKFGLLNEGIGKGSVDWNKVRQAEIGDIFEAIKSGGLAATKSKRIKEILDMVYQENIERRESLLKAKEDDKPALELKATENQTSDDKNTEIAKADQNVLSLDHLHSLGSDDALNALIKYPGIGPKTASCVLLFCMQRPSFAVDTHVFRLCKWLKWVPVEKANRNSTYSHCEVRIPDSLKYPLHQLFIKHGKICPRCRAATGENSEDWDKGCVIDHLLTRTGKRKGGALETPKRRSKAKEGEDEDDQTDEDATASEDDNGGAGAEEELAGTPMKRGAGKTKTPRKVLVKTPSKVPLKTPSKTLKTPKTPQTLIENPMKTAAKTPKNTLKKNPGRKAKKAAVNTSMSDADSDFEVSGTESIFVTPLVKLPKSRKPRKSRAKPKAEALDAVVEDVSTEEATAEAQNASAAPIPTDPDETIDEASSPEN